MVGLGIFCIFLALFSAISAATSGAVAGFGVAVIWAAVGSLLIARGRDRQKQKQSQQQTVIVNNYITQVPEPQKQQDDVQQS